MNSCNQDKFSTEKIVKDQSGQTLVEFLLLLSMIMTLSFMFMKTTNNFMANYWTTIVNLIVTDGQSKSGSVSIE